MKETVASEQEPAPPPPDPMGAESDLFAGSVLGRSQIVWGEHCSECDYPRCYSTCSFYSPRPDLNCRRFVGGIETERTPAGAPLMRIRFKKWGKLEGKGPAHLWPVQGAARRQARDEWVSKALGIVPTQAARQSLSARWNRRKEQPPARAAQAPEAFVVEGWTRDGSTRRFTLTFLQSEPRRAQHQVPFELGPKYSRLEVPAAKIGAMVDLKQPWLVQIEPIGEAEGIDVVLGLADFVALAPRPQAVSSEAPALPLVKVLVWDLDETLWSGILAEDGVEGVKLKPEAVALVKALDERGVLQSVASKNDAKEALAALKQFGLDQYFLHPQINWGPKSTSAARIAEVLSLGLDTFAFIDDSPFERGEVQATHPALRVFPETAAGELAAHPWFDHPVTPESGKRRLLYLAEAQRTAEFEAASGDYLAFLRSSQLVLEVAPLGTAEAERIFELSQRTNQLNFTGAKFSRDDVEGMLKPDPARRRLTLRCRDRFGDYGLIGFADLQLDTAELVSFFMSCRVQRKKVEHAFFQHAAGLLAGKPELRVRFRSTPRNGASVAMLTELGFAQGAPGQDGLLHWRRGLDQPFPDSDVVALSATGSTP